MRTLWGRLNSVNVQKAVWALDEAGLPFEAIPAGGAHGVVHDAAYRALNPNGLVPTLVEDGFVLWESNAILRYVAAASPVLAPPEDPRQRALIDQWLDWQATSFTPGMRDAFWQLFRSATPDRAASRSPTSPWAAPPTAGSTCRPSAPSGRTSSAGTRAWPPAPPPPAPSESPWVE